MGMDLERLRPQERALVCAAEALGIVQYSDDGRGIMINLGDPKLKEKYNVLAPATTVTKADPNFTPAISVVTLDVKDAYPVAKGDNADSWALPGVNTQTVD